MCYNMNLLICGIQNYMREADKTEMGQSLVAAQECSVMSCRDSSNQSCQNNGGSLHDIRGDRCLKKLFRTSRMIFRFAIVGS